MKKPRRPRRGKLRPLSLRHCVYIATTLTCHGTLQADLIHRWSFDNAAGAANSGATIPDRVGGEGFQATVLGAGATFTGTAIDLPGGGSGTAAYVDLPNGLVSQLQQVTIEGWFTVDSAAGGNWTRVFDFGSGQAGEVAGPGGGFEGTNYLFYSTATGGDYNTQQLEIRVAAGDGNNTVWRPDRPVAYGQQVYFAVTVDSSSGSGSTVNLWRNNEHIVVDGTTPFMLSDVQDVNNWLGRSNWSGDGNLDGKINEFRIYDTAFSPDQINASRSSGPDTLVVDTDNDGMPDGWETANGLNVGVNDANQDTLDNDGLTNIQEYQRGTDPRNPDTDGDGLKDGVETDTGAFVSATDTGTHPLRPDTDGDGLSDGVETNTGTFVSATDTGTHPLAKDTDNDTFGDGSEVASGTNPLSEQNPPTPRLMHRYSFTETSGRRVEDSVGGAHGIILGQGFAREGGSLALSGGSSNTAAYVALPQHMLSNHGISKGGRGMVSIEGWATVTEVTGNWARLIDFGSSQTGPGNPGIFAPGNYNGGGGDGQDYLFLSAHNGTDTANRQVTLRSVEPPGNGDWTVATGTATFGSPFHFAITYDESSGRLSYYENGTQMSSTVTTNATNPVFLSDVNDVNCWLGRSNWMGDANLAGSYDELRIYDGILSAEDIAASTTAGPDAAPVFPAATDTDSDGMPDWFERAYGLNPNSNADAATDADSDGVSNLAEFQRSSSPLRADTDSDGLPDAAETNTGTFVSAANAGSSPIAFDTDSDIAGDAVEAQAGSNPVDAASASYPPQLLHRWSFNNPEGEAPNTSTVLDSVTNEENAIIKGEGAFFTGSGVTLPGGGSATAAYVDLPNGLISPLNQVTLEGWASIDTFGNAWARIFDFGNTNGNELTEAGGGGDGGDYLIFTASNGTDYNINRLEFREAIPGPVVNAAYDLAVTPVEGEFFHFAVTVYSPEAGRSYMAAWRDGQLLIPYAHAPVSLSQVGDVNNWLGRSNWTGDANLAGTFDEFRIYNGAINDAAVRANREAGPDVIPGTQPPASTIQIVSVSAPPGQPLTFSFTSTAGRSYQVQTSTGLLPEAAPAGGWQNQGAPIAATGALTTFTDTAPPSGTKFYRVKEVTGVANQ